mgnify:CR=1 FL=1
MTRSPELLLFSGSKKPWPLMVSLFSVGLLLASCGGEGAAPGRNVAVDARLSLERLPPPEGLAVLDFETTHDLAWVGDTALALLDVHGRKVVVQPLDGSPAVTVGREGGGPGEFGWPVRLHVDQEGRLLVADTRPLRMSLFGPNLRHRATRPLPGMPLDFLGVRNGRAVLAWIGFRSAEAGPRIGAVDLESGAVETWFEVFEADPALRHPSPTGGSRRFVSVAGEAGRGILVGEGSEYRLTAFDTGGTVLGSLGRRGATSEPRTDREIEERLENLGRNLEAAGAPVSTRVLEQAEGRLRQQEKPLFAGFTVDDRGRTWVVTTRSTGGESEIDIFDAGGRFVGTHRVRDRALAVRVRGSKMAVLVERRDGELEGLEGVDLYEIRPGRPD